MVSTLKVTKIQIPNSDSDVISLDASSGNITVPKPVNFSGTVTGTAMVKLLDVSDISSAATYAINNTYINSTYDRYLVQAFFKPVTDGVTLYQRLYISASQDDGALTQGSVAPNSWEYAQIGGSNTSGGDNTAAGATMHFTTIGNAAGEGIHWQCDYYAKFTFLDFLLLLLHIFVR